MKISEMNSLIWPRYNRDQRGLMLIREQVVIIWLAQALFKPAQTSYLELQFGIIQLIMAHNITLFYLLKRSSRAHTKTQMGSGHFPNEGYGEAAYIRNIEVLDENYEIAPAPQLQYISPEKPNCYWARIGSPSETWGSYMFFGGPGRNVNCP
ncbi:hypothetical protein STAS_28925 [Striga asiatica]|uniref:Neprosin PEP catalytic domain-containing protein n=1 Tax=Striga asiatica TaxID=4170 RepID=A0A5A7R5G1_STRAF|nr:hypothetical protein STAS_28925 [Striga asiatica]